MGIYNCATTLSEAIESIISQSYSDWKLIMCDDGSIDDTYSIAEEYRSNYPEKIVLIRNTTNQGLNYTLNHCLQYADTEYIARMDGDDISLPDRFEKEVQFLDNNKEYAIVSTPMIYFDENGEWSQGKGNGEVNLEDAAKGTPFCHAPCMVRKEAYDAVNGYSVDDKLLRVEDYDLWIRMLARGYKGYNLEKPFYMMRDDRNATKRRKYKYRINEARVHKKAVRLLHLKKRNYVYVLRPLIVGLIPAFFYDYLHRNKNEKL